MTGTTFNQNTFNAYDYNDRSEVVAGQESLGRELGDGRFVTLIWHSLISNGVAVAENGGGTVAVAQLGSRANGTAHFQYPE